MSGLRPFALHRPETVAEAASLLAEHGDEAVLYAGGTELLILLKAGLARPRCLVDVKRIGGLGAIEAADTRLVIGATASHRDVERSGVARHHCPLVAGVARHVANVRVRNVGTVGGNLAFADPHSDLATVFLVFDARVVLVSDRGDRTVALDEFVRGPYETARGGAEILTAVRLTPWAAGTAGVYLKYGIYERPTLGIAVALVPAGDSRPATLEALVADAPTDSNRAAAVGASPTELRMAVGCVGPRPLRLTRVEEAARGLDAAEIERRADDLASLAADEVDPMADLHGSAEYKREMTRVFTRRAVAVAARRALGTEPDARYAHTVVV
jgi:carbon-monoxide dehydrogenase medium subunit